MTKRIVGQAVQLSTKSRTQSYYPEIDGLRFVAFLLVFMHHSLVYRWLRPFGVNFVFTEPYRFIGFIGWTGVDLFFAISGFLITDLLLQEREKFGIFSLKNFWIRRFLRIWPLYFLVIGISYGVLSFVPEFNALESQYGSITYWSDIKGHLPYFAAFLGNWSVVVQGWPASGTLGLLWSVSMEEQFYFVWPPILKFISLRGALRVLLVFCGLNLVARAVLVKALVAPNAISPIIYNPFSHGEPIALGILLAVLRTRKEAWQRLRAWRALYPAAGVLLIAGSLGVADIYQMPPTSFSYHVVWQYSAIAIGCVLLVAGCVMQSETPGACSPYLLLRNPLAVWLGKISYGLYVYHLWGMMVSYWFFLSFGATFNFETRQYATDLPTDMLWWLTSLIATVAMAASSYFLVERRFLRLKSRFTSIESRPT